MPDRDAATGSTGASQGLEAAFRHFSGDLYRYVLRRLRRPEDAADLTQEIFERFMRGEGAAKVRNAQAYLFGIAANAVADARMAQGQDPVTYDSDATSKLTEQLPASRPQPADELEEDPEVGLLDVDAVDGEPDDGRGVAHAGDPALGRTASSPKSPRRRSWFATSKGSGRAVVGSMTW